MLILMVLLSLLSLALLIAMPVFQTQKWREREEDLLFYGRQYVEAVRLFVQKNPGSFPKSIEELVKKRYLRKAYADPMTRDGKWNIILLPGIEDGGGESAGIEPEEEIEEVPEESAREGDGTSGAGSVAKVMLVPEKLLSSVDHPRIIGVASTSNRKSFYVYDENESYDTWLFFYGRQKGAKPEIIRFGAPTK